MSRTDSEVVSITVDASGDGSANTANAYRGPLRTIIYTPDATSPYATGFVVLVKSAVTNQTLWTETAVGVSAVTINPRQPMHDNTRTPLLYAAAGLPVDDYYFLANEAINITIASAGNATTGAFTIIAG